MEKSYRTEPLTLLEVVLLLGKIIKGRESYIYKSDHNRCEYRDKHGNPSCIIGRLLKQAGFKLPSYSSHANVANITYTFPEYFTPDALKFARTVQERQDGGKTWGYAVNEAMLNCSSFISVNEAIRRVSTP